MAIDILARITKRHEYVEWANIFMDSVQGLESALITRGVAYDLAADGANITSPKAVARSFDAAVLFIDISDFTPLTEKFERMGPDGVELLTDALNRYFGIMIETIIACGGEVDSLFGDALLAYWPLNDEKQAAERARHVAECAKDLQGKLADTVLQDGTRLNVHCAAAFGQVQRLYLGGHDKHRMTLLTGKPINDLDGLLDSAGRNEIVIDAGFAELLDGQFEGKRFADGSVRLDALKGNAPKSAFDDQPPDAAAAAPYLYQFLQNGLYERIRSTGANWIAELRNLTVVFASLDDLDINDGTDLDRLQGIAMAMQAHVHEFGGAVQSLTAGDKGVVFYAAYGLPLLAHEDDAVRAIAASQGIANSLAELGCRPSIGICTGMTYCGLLGTDDWRSYSVRGTVTNRAARLMSLREGQIVVDAATRSAAGARVEFQPERAIKLKGISGKVQVSSIGDGAVSHRIRDARTNMIGRKAEFELVLQLISKFQSVPATKVVLFEGVPGIGKTTLLDEITAQTQQLGKLICAKGGVDALESKSVYAAWSAIYGSLLEDDFDRSIAQLFGEDAAWLNRVPLLSTVLRRPIEDNPLTTQMEGDTRSDNTNAIMREVITRAASKSPLMIVIDDCQWMDTASLRLLTQLIQAELPIMFILGARPDQEATKEFIAEIETRPNTTRIRLDEMDAHSVQGLICATMDVDTVAATVVEFVFSRSGGNPYFAHELVRALLEQDHIEIQDRACNLVNAAVDLNKISFPDTIERVIISRVDRLAPDLQLTLKAASVIGQQFQFDALQGTHPLQPAAEECRELVEECGRRDFTPRLQNAPQLVYFFRHILAHQTVYGLLTFAGRRELHHAVGSWIETNIDNARQTQKITLAHHWSMAGRPDLALEYLEAAGDEALSAGAYAEAASFYNRALEAIDKSGADARPERVAEIHFRLGEINTRLGETEQSFEDFTNGLNALGESWPRSGGGLALGILSSIGKQIWHRIRGMKPDASKPINKRELVLSSGMEKFSYLFFFDQRFVDLLLSVLRAINYAEQSNSTQAVRRTFAEITVSLAIARLVKWADFYAQRAQELPLEGSNDFDKAFQLNYLALFSLGLARFDDAHDYLKRGLAFAQNIGNRRLEIDLLSFTRSAYFMSSRFAECKQADITYQAAADAADDKQHKYFSRISRAEVHMRFGEFEAARELLVESKNLLLPNLLLDRLQTVGLLSFVEYRLGNGEAALIWGKEALDLIKTAPPIGYYTVEAYAAVTDLFIVHARDAIDGHDSTAVRLKLAKQALGKFDAFSKSFPIARPKFLIRQGEMLKQQSKEAKARKSFEAALAQAQAQNQPYEAALAHHWLGQLSNDDNASRQEHLQMALEGYRSCGLSQDAAGVELLLAN